MKMEAEPSDLKEVKKLLKPLVEKRRRDRMNRSLDQLKSFLLKHSRSQSFRNGKMEKAEILEMTVQYLKNAAPPDVQEHGTGIPQLNYEAGFQECFLQVNNFVRSCASINAQAKSSLVERLANFVDRSRADSQSRDGEGGSSRQPQPGHSAALGPLEMVPVVSSNLHPQQGSHLLASQSVSFQQTQNPVDIHAGSHELVQHSCAHFADVPEKRIVCPKPICGQQGSNKLTVSQNVWRPWP